MRAGRMRIGRVVAALGLCCIGCRAEPEAQPVGAPPKGIPDPYLSTRDQPGHELAKTEQFIVPRGTTIIINGLEFAARGCPRTTLQQRILAQVFNSIEEITENTNGDPDSARVAEYRLMRFEIRGYSTLAPDPEVDRALSQECAESVRYFLSDRGTPAWRLEARGMGRGKSALEPAAGKPPAHRLWVEFRRIQ